MSACKEELFERVAPLALSSMAAAAGAALFTPVALLVVLPLFG